MPPHLVSGYVAPKLVKGKATIEFIRPGIALDTVLTLITETDGRFVANIPAEGRTRAFVEPGRRLLFVAGSRGAQFSHAMPLWIDVKPNKTYLVHIEVEDDEMNPTPVRPDRVRQWQHFRAWRDETRLYAVGNVPVEPVVSEEVCKRWYSGYSQRWNREMDDAARLAHTLLPEDGH